MKRTYIRKMNWYQLYMMHSMVGDSISKDKSLNEIVPVKNIKVLANSESHAMEKLSKKLPITFGSGSRYSIKIIKGK
tara:strand:+ start:1384 stop:1614 length:231 start_codon:yes stop_codon:yes gene_type:complete